jgi:hypothetical protein
MKTVFTAPVLHGIGLSMHEKTENGIICKVPLFAPALHQTPTCVWVTFPASVSIEEAYAKFRVYLNAITDSKFLECEANPFSKKEQAYLKKLQELQNLNALEVVHYELTVVVEAPLQKVITKHFKEQKNTVLKDMNGKLFNFLSEAYLYMLEKLFY